MHIKVSIKVQRIIRNLSRISILINLDVKWDISLYSPIKSWEFNNLIILKFKISHFVLHLWSSKYF